MHCTPFSFPHFSYFLSTLWYYIGHVFMFTVVFFAVFDYYTKKFKSRPIISALEENTLPIKCISFAGLENSEDGFFHDCSRIDTSANAVVNWMNGANILKRTKFVIVWQKDNGFYIQNFSTIDLTKCKFDFAACTIVTRGLHRVPHIVFSTLPSLPMNKANVRASARLSFNQMNNRSLLFSFPGYFLPNRTAMNTEISILIAMSHNGVGNWKASTENEMFLFTLNCRQNRFSAAAGVGGGKVVQWKWQKPTLLLYIR